MSKIMSNFWEFFLVCWIKGHASEAGQIDEKDDVNDGNGISQNIFV